MGLIILKSIVFLFICLTLGRSYATIQLFASNKQDLPAWIWEAPAIFLTAFYVLSQF